MLRVTRGAAGSSCPSGPSGGGTSSSPRRGVGDDHGEADRVADRVALAGDANFEFDAQWEAVGRLGAGGRDGGAEECGAEECGNGEREDGEREDQKREVRKREDGYGEAAAAEACHRRCVRLPEEAGQGGRGRGIAGEIQVVGAGGAELLLDGVAELGVAPGERGRGFCGMDGDQDTGLGVLQREQAAGGQPGLGGVVDVQRQHVMGDGELAQGRLPVAVRSRRAAEVPR